MALRPEKNSPANLRLVEFWEDLSIDLPYSAEEFIDLIDSTDVILLLGVPDGADLSILAMFVDAIRKMHGVDHDGARESLDKIDRALDARSSLRKAYIDKVLGGDENAVIGRNTVKKSRDR